MNRLTAKHILISSIALSIALGGSTLFMTENTTQASNTLEQQAATIVAADQAVHKQHDAPHNHKHEGKGIAILDETASILGIDHEALKQSLKEGKSLVEIAQAKGTSEADLTAKLLALRTNKIDQAVKDGKLTADKAAKMKQRMNEHLTFMLNEKNLLDRHDKHEQRRHGHKPDIDKMAQIIGITKEDLEAQLKAGKSLTEIAAAKGINKDQLIEKIKEQLTPSLEKMADHKKGDHKEKNAK